MKKTEIPSAPARKVRTMQLYLQVPASLSEGLSMALAHFQQVLQVFAGMEAALRDAHGVESLDQAMAPHISTLSEIMTEEEAGEEWNQWKARAEEWAESTGAQIPDPAQTELELI